MRGAHDARRSERGQAVLLFVAFFSIMLIMGAFVIDQGVWLGKRRITQKDADNAARGGALAFLTNPVNYSGAESFAAGVAFQNLAGSSSDTTYDAGPDCTPYTGDTIYGVPSVEVVVTRPTRALFSLPWLDGVNPGAQATACVGQPSGLGGNAPFYIAPGGADTCFNDSTLQPNVGGQCVFKTASQPTDNGSRGMLSIADTSDECTKDNKSGLIEDVAVGTEGYCEVGDRIEVAEGNNTNAAINGMQCRLQGGCQGAIGEGACDDEFHDPNGETPPFTGPNSPSGIDDFTEVFSRPDGGSPQGNWASTGETLIPNSCDGRISPRVITIVIADGPPTIGQGGNNKTIGVVGFATFYVVGCVRLDQDGNVQGTISRQCSANGQGAIVGLFVEALIPDGGGDPLPPEPNSSLSIFLVR